MIYKKMGLVIIFALIVSSCGYFCAPRYIKHGFTIKFENKYTGIDSFIKIKGYYEIKIPFQRTIYAKGWKLKVERYEPDTIHARLVFYPNGIYLRDFHDYISIDQGKTENIGNYFSNIVNDTIGKVSKGFYNNSIWGSYKIVNDTIKAQYVCKPAFGQLATFWYAYEIWYKVIDRKTIREINQIPIHKMSDSDWYNWDKSKSERKYNTANFIPVDTIPNPDSWIVKRKWYLKNNEGVK